jgi:NadR type nicotinamide-nucleotide adenylyltransferase
MGIIRIAVTGPECSGKSELTKALSEHFQVPHADEYAREFLAKSGGKYDADDLVAICKGQIAAEEAASAKAQNLVVFDTDMLVLKIWALFRFGQVPSFIEESNYRRPYHLRLLCKPDLPWEPDPFRESPDDKERELLFGFYERQLTHAGATFEVVEGTGDERFKSAISAVERHFAAV